MSDFTKAMAPRIDSDGLVGNVENPTKWSSGNQILDTAISCIYEVRLNGRSADLAYLKARESALLACQNPDGTFNKNPGRDAQITKDDLKAAAVLTRICGMPFARTIVERGRANQWDLSNTGKPYVEAFAKPWDIPIYTISASLGAEWDRSIALAMAIVVDAYYGDVSANRLMWVSSHGISDVYPVVDSALWLWRREMRVKYVTVGGMMLKYISKEEDPLTHPYVIYGRQLGF